MKRWLILWVLLACGVCWIPSEWLTGLEEWLVPATKGQSKAALFWGDVKEPLAHGLLMVGVGFFMMRMISKRHNTVGSEIDDEAGCSRNFPSMVAPATDCNNSPEGLSRAEAEDSRGPTSRHGRLLFVLMGVMLIALVIEAGQAVLPSFFQRGYALEDLVASFVGGLIGVIVGLRHSSVVI